MKLTVFVTLSDDKDGSYSASVYGTKEEALEDLDRTEEQLEEGTFYDDGMMFERTMEIKMVKDKPVLTKGFSFSTDG